MGLLPYLLSFTLLIMSVIKVTDFFIKTDHELDKKQEVFIKKTRSFHQKQNNQKGSISLMGVMFTAILSLLLVFFALKMKVELKEARYRKDSYLCFHYLNIETEKYIKAMTVFNWSLRSLYTAINAGAVQLVPVYEGTQFTRNIKHFLYIKDLMTNKYCKGKTDGLSYLKNLPYKTSLAYTLTTNIDASTLPRKSKWSVTLYKNPQGIRFKKSFCLKADYSLEGAFVPNLKVQTSEIMMTAFSNLKCSSGFL